MQAANAYTQEMEAKLKEWSAQINLLEAILGDTGAETKVRRAESVLELRARQNAAAEKMRKLRESTGIAQEAAKATADRMRRDFQACLAEALPKLK